MKIAFNPIPLSYRTDIQFFKYNSIGKQLLNELKCHKIYIKKPEITSLAASIKLKLKLIQEDDTLKRFDFKLKSDQYIRYTRKLFNKTGNEFCYICGKIISRSQCSIDHIIPLSKSGSSKSNNLTFTHLVCNNIKDSSIIKYYNKFYNVIRFFYYTKLKTHRK